ncbi:hypothetical protein C8R48DRAFT_679120 [Suillus tomentosus]|nr:hypothetical protein C8R48DRAFT_679120 [Suillus tomentosus]
MQDRRAPSYHPSGAQRSSDQSAYPPLPQPGPPQPQTQDTRYTPTQEARNTYPPPTLAYPPAQDTRLYAPPPPVEHTYSQTEVRGYPGERQQQLGYSHDAQQARVNLRPCWNHSHNPSHLTLIHNLNLHASTAERPPLGAVEPRAVEVRPTSLQSQSVWVGDASERSGHGDAAEECGYGDAEATGVRVTETTSIRVAGAGVETQTQTQVFETQGGPAAFESHPRPTSEPQRQTMIESQPRFTVLESQVRPTPFEPQPRPAVLESQPRPSMMLEGPARSTGFISQSQSQSQSQGSQKGCRR